MGGIQPHDIQKSETMGKLQTTEPHCSAAAQLLTLHRRQQWKILLCYQDCKLACNATLRVSCSQHRTFEKLKLHKISHSHAYSSVLANGQALRNHIVIHRVRTRKKKKKN